MLRRPPRSTRTDTLFPYTTLFRSNDDDASDVRDVDLTTVHYRSGPVGVEGAEPGDLLVVDLLDIGAKQDSLWGFNGFFSQQNGGGFLTDHFPHAQKSIWDFQGLFTSSRHIPGVRFAGQIHPGLIGCLPDHKMLATRSEARRVGKGCVSTCSYRGSPNHKKKKKER